MHRVRQDNRCTGRWKAEPRAGCNHQQRGHQHNDALFRLHQALDAGDAAEQLGLDQIEAFVDLRKTGEFARERGFLHCRLKRLAMRQH